MAETKTKSGLGGLTLTRATMPEAMLLSGIDQLSSHCVALAASCGVLCTASGTTSSSSPGATWTRCDTAEGGVPSLASTPFSPATRRIGGRRAAKGATTK